MKRSWMIVLVCMVSLSGVARADALKRVYVAPEGNAPAVVEYASRDGLHKIAPRRFALSLEQATRYARSFKASLLDRSLPRGTYYVLSHWDDYVVLIAEGAIETGAHKIRVVGTDRHVLESMSQRQTIDARFLETFNDGVDDGGCGLWEAVLDAKTYALELFSCHGGG